MSEAVEATPLADLKDEHKKAVEAKKDENKDLNKDNLEDGAKVEDGGKITIQKDNVDLVKYHTDLAKKISKLPLSAEKKEEIDAIVIETGEEVKQERLQAIHQEMEDIIKSDSESVASVTEAAPKAELLSIEKSSQEFLKKGEAYNKLIDGKMNSSTGKGMLNSVAKSFGIDLKALINDSGLVGMFVRGFFGISDSDAPADMPEDMKKNLDTKYLSKTILQKPSVLKGQKEGGKFEKQITALKSKPETGSLIDTLGKKFGGEKAAEIKEVGKNGLVLEASSASQAAAITLLCQKNTKGASLNLDKLKDSMPDFVKDADFSEMGFSSGKGPEVNRYPDLQKDWPPMVYAIPKGGNKVAIGWINQDKLSLLGGKKETAAK